VAGEPKGKLPSLEVALIGTLFMAALICLRLWFIMADIRQALTDPNAMAFIITDNGIKSDNKQAEVMIDNARLGFHDTERVVAIFSVALLLIAVALVVRIWQRPVVAPGIAGQQSQRTKRKRPLTH
jgi:hypothetical protein